MAEFTGEMYELPQEDKNKVGMGFLPAAEHILTILSNTAHFATLRKEEIETYHTLIGWAFLKNGVVMPLIYDHEFHTCRNPEVLEDFVEIAEAEEDDDDDEDDEKEFEKF